ncbi:granzyme-like protein 1 [Myxocyprinus asiaticus]|uniref:granzyme-like protein 1 n=1 Tax=Myxocyprinus asiaticus TaxID=70543 RepID=UPI00222175E2|nr:granzyme-like protein 1 [Myxocyprinus asiaticus]
MIISLLLLGSLLPYLTLTAYVNVGIVNGTEAKPHSRPYMVSLQHNEKHTCGGFLLSKEFVMTAAHCFKERQNMTVMIGAHECNSGSSRMAVKFYHIHPGYDSKTLRNDIMLLQLNGTAKQSEKVNWISIPKKDGDIKANSKCSVAGWGKNRTNGSTSNRLMEVDVTIKDKKTCKKSWGQTYSTSRMVCAGGHGGFCQLNGTFKNRKTVKWIPTPKQDGDIKANSKCSVAGWGKNRTNGSTSNRLMEMDVTIKDKKTCKKSWVSNYSTSRMVCAGGHGGFCQGDSGGPLVCGGTAVGAVSFSEKNNCDTPTNPNVYTKISAFLTWINAILGGVNQDLD